MLDQTETQTRETNLLKLFVALLKQDRTNVISETEPWGTLIALEAKRNETRTWPARLSYNGPVYHGPIAIHCSKRMDDSVCFQPPFADALQVAGYTPRMSAQSNLWGLPLGHIIAVAWLESVWQINDHTIARLPDQKSAERAFGNYQQGRFVWTFSCAYRLSQPIPIERGEPFIWKWTPPSQFWNEIQGQADQLRSQIKGSSSEIVVGS